VPITLRASATAQAPSATSLTIVVPSWLPGDVLTAVVVDRSGATFATAPAGWTSQGQFSGGNLGGELWTRVASSEPADYTWTLSGGANLAGGIDAWTGVDTTTPIDASGTSNSAVSASPIGTGITTVTDGAMLLFAIGFETGKAAVITPPGSMIEAWEAWTSTGADHSAALAYETVTTAGATGTRTASTTNSDRWVTRMWALRPAPVGRSLVFRPRPLRGLIGR
jgi:hypothetical protein